MSESSIEKFRRLIAQIHRDTAPSNGDEERLDRAEFRAACNAFLGPGYDPAKLVRVEALLFELREEQARLVAGFECGQLAPRDYVESLNRAVHTHMLACQDALGPQDYERLFREPVSEAVAVVDEATFLQSVEDRRSHRTRDRSHGGQCDSME